MSPNPVFNIVEILRSLASLLSFSKIMSFSCHIFVYFYRKIVLFVQKTRSSSCGTEWDCKERGPTIENSDISRLYSCHNFSTCDLVFAFCVSHGLEFTFIWCLIQFNSSVSEKKDFFKVAVTLNDYIEIGYEPIQVPGENYF